MNEQPPGVLKRPWRGWTKILAWFALLFGATFVIFCGIALATGGDNQSWQLIPVGLAAALAVSAIVVGLVLFLRWFCRWRILRPFLYGVAGLVILILLAYAEENWRGKHAWTKYRQHWEAKGERFDLRAIVPPPVPDDENFALTPLLAPLLDLIPGPGPAKWRDPAGLARLEKIQAEIPCRESLVEHLSLGSLEKGTFADIPTCADFYRGNTNYPQAAATATPTDTMLVALDKFTPEFNELCEAAASRTNCRFPVHYEQEPCWAILLPHLAKIKGLTVVLHVRATAELEAGRPTHAFEDLKLGLFLSDSIREEPLLIDHLVRIATLALDLQTIREGLVRHAWSEAQLAELQARLSKLDLLAEYKRSMIGERALTITGLDFLRRQRRRVNPQEYFGDSKDPWQVLIFTPMPSGWFYQNMLNISQNFQDFTLPAIDERAHRVFPERCAEGERALHNLRAGPYTLFAKMLLPALQNATRKSARMQTFVDATRVACGIERYHVAKGKLPENLEQMVPAFLVAVPNDVIDGKALRYHPAPDGGYVLYSVGWNKIDDGGELPVRKHNNDRNVDPTQGDWVWLMAARQE